MVESPDLKIPFRGEIYEEDRDDFNRIRQSRDYKVAQLFHELMKAYKEKNNLQ